MYKQYKAVGACIYCGAVGNDLSKEHIIPYSMGGSLILPRASCARHRDITSILERRVTRDMYGIYREITGVQSRHKNRREQRRHTTASLDGTTFGGLQCTVDVPIQELPRLHVSVHLPVPQILSSEALTEGCLGSYVRSQSDPVTMQRLLDKHKLKTITAEASIQIETFIRAIAKIGHAFSVAEYGHGNFTPTLIPIIEGTTNNLLQYVGAESPEQPQSKCPLSVDEINRDGKRYLSVSVSLHAFPNLPRYQVIAGHIEVESGGSES